MFVWLSVMFDAVLLGEYEDSDDGEDTNDAGDKEANKRKVWYFKLCAGFTRYCIV